MFNPVKFSKFMGKVSLTLVTILGIASALAVWTELSMRDENWNAVVRAPGFWLSVLRDLIPALLALLAVYVLAARFVRAVYATQDVAEGRGFVNRRLWGMSGFAPWQRVSGGEAEGGADHVLHRIGGPGNLVVYNDSAVLLERGGRFTRVEQKGFPPLDAFEKVYATVDVRPKRWVHPVNAMSKEGIPITCEADISYQIDIQNSNATQETPYPVSAEVVLRAVTSTWIREATRPTKSRTMDWAGRVIISETEGSLRTILARYPLDRLVGLAGPHHTSAREEIRQELERALRSSVPKLGARILGVEMGDIQVDDAVTQQWIDAWSASWQAWATEREAMGRARQTEQLENAKTRAQVIMLTTIANAFQPLVAEEQVITSRLVLTRLFMVLSKGPRDPLTRVNLPQEAIKTLQMLRDTIIS